LVRVKELRVDELIEKDNLYYIKNK